MQKIKKILCTTDLSGISDYLFFRGVELCRGFDASLSFFHAVSPPRGSVFRQIEFERGGEKEEKIKKAQGKIKTIMAHFDIQYDAVITYGDPVLELAKAAKKISPDIIIAASYGLSGFQQFFIGSVVGRMARTLAQPFLVIPPEEIVLGAARPERQFKTIMIACNLSKSDDDLKSHALNFSEKFDSKIHLVHVMESPVNEKIIDITSAPYDEAQTRLEEKLSSRLKNIMPAQTHIMHGIPGEELSRYAKINEIDLILAGSDSHAGKIITSTTAALLRHAPCAVLTVPFKLNGDGLKI